MKKYLPIMFIIILAVVIVCCVSVVLTYEPIPVTDGLRFGMSPKQVAKVLGKHYEVEYDAGSTGKAVYSYQTVVLGQDAVVTCYFWMGRELTEVVFEWQTNPAELRNQAYMRIYDHYHKKKDFFTNEVHNSSAEEKHISLGIDNGLTGIFYNLYETSTALRISCVKLS